VSTRGAYVVAFGDPARACAVRLIASIRRHMPGLPVAVAGETAIGIEDVFVAAPDADVGGRRAKLRAYELAPAEWQSVLYLDADTELVAPIDPLFEWVESGWEFVICRDVGETLHSFQRKNNLRELAELRSRVGSFYAVQLNGGVWAFRRCETMRRFMARWRAEYEVHLQRDQGALIRALWADPVRVLVVEHTWNCFPKYTPHVKQPTINHYPEDARRWRGKLPGRIDGADAWAIVRRWETAQR
jgi:hypothetical protein